MFLSMKRIYPILAALFFSSLVAVIWNPVKNYIQQDTCLDAGGKWTPQNVCISPNCAENNSKLVYPKMNFSFNLACPCNRLATFIHSVVLEVVDHPSKQQLKMAYL